jgi:hypothetical protein
MEEIGDGHSVESGVRMGDFEAHCLKAGLSLFSIDLLLCYTMRGAADFWMINSGGAGLFNSSA